MGVHDTVVGIAAHAGRAHVMGAAADPYPAPVERSLPDPLGQVHASLPRPPQFLRQDPQGSNQTRRVQGAEPPVQNGCLLAQGIAFAAQGDPTLRVRSLFELREHMGIAPAQVVAPDARRGVQEIRDAFGERNLPAGKLAQGEDTVEETLLGLDPVAEAEARVVS